MTDKRDECGCHRGCVTTFHARTRPCRWPSCLTPEEHAELAAEVMAELTGLQTPTGPRPDECEALPNRRDPRDRPLGPGGNDQGSGVVS